MIAKITKGASFAGLANYLHGPGREQEHFYGLAEGGQVIGGNLMVEGDRDGHRWAKDMHAAASRREDIERPVWHMSLRAAPTDPRLTDAQWRDIAQAHAEHMGWSSHPWVVVRHGEDHVHVVVCRVDFDGHVWSHRNDRYKAREASLQVEKQYRLRSTEKDAPQRARARSYAEPVREKVPSNLTQGEFRRGERTGKTPERLSLAATVRASRDHAVRVGGGVAEFEAALRENGVQFRANVASTGRVSGYSFHQPGHVDAKGEPIWLKASDLDRSLSWGKLSKALSSPPPQRIPMPQVEPKRFLERSASYEARVQAAKVQAVQEFRAKSAKTMHANLAKTHVRHALDWQGRKTEKTAKAKTWALNVHKRAQERAQVKEMMAARATWAPKPQDVLKAPSSPAYQLGAQTARAMIAAMQDPDNSRNRGRGMSR